MACPGTSHPPQHPATYTPRTSFASAGVSQLVNTRRLRALSTQPMKRAKSPLRSGEVSACLPRMISPLVPLRLMKSPSRICWLPMRATLLRSSTCGA
eukprot:scaffold225998_cov22-Tisochrysis_lutea.AAC.3